MPGTHLAPIVADWKRIAVAINHVKPLDFKETEQIHMVGGSPWAASSDRDQA